MKSVQINIKDTRKMLLTSFWCLIVKACIRYFLFFYQMIARQKLWKMLLFISLFVLEIFRFLYFYSPFFFSLSAIALEEDRI